MRPAVLILGIAAFVIAGGAGLMLQQYMASQDARLKEASTTPVYVAPKTSSVMVANDTIGVGKALEEANLSWQEWPDRLVTDSGWTGIVIAKSDADKAALSKTYIGAITRSPLVKGEPITEEKVVMAGKGSTLATILHPGMRSITIPVDAILTADGLIQPGDRVDLILTYDLPDLGAGQVDEKTGLQKPHYLTETFLRNVNLLSLNKRFTTSVAPDAPVPSNATLEVTAVQAEKIATATRMGKISLTLRPLQVSDDKISGNDRGFITDLSVLPALQAARLGREYNPDANPFDMSSKIKAEEEERRKAEQANKKPPSITVYRWSAPTQVPLNQSGKPVDVQQPNGASPAPGTIPSARQDTNTNKAPEQNSQPAQPANRSAQPPAPAEPSNPFNSGAGSSGDSSPPPSDTKNIYHYNGPSHGV